MCSPAPALGFCAQWELSLTDSAGRGPAPGGQCGFQDITWRLPGELPPSSETLLSPTAQVVLLSTSSSELPADKEDTPSLRLGVYVSVLSGLFYLPVKNVDKYYEASLAKHNITPVRCE